jgi:putative hydrolase of the HAD superfamily
MQNSAEHPSRPLRWLLFDWGDTLMRSFPEYSGPMANWPRLEALPGAVETLAALHHEWSLALATNAADSDEGQIREALQRVGLGDFIDRIHCFRTTRRMKPAPEFFTHILADLGAAPSQAVMVGDSFEVDVLGANRCVLRAVWLNERSSREETSAMVRTIHTLSSLPQALRSFEG